jgi:hypothetical protein
MPKLGGPLPRGMITKIRKAYEDILKKNKDLKAVVDAQTRGKKGQAKTKARRKSIKGLIQRNELFLNAVREKLTNL